MSDLTEAILYPKGRLRGHDGRRLCISYPLPFDEVMGNLRVPKDLTQEEADRVKAMVDSLVLAYDEASGSSDE